MVDPLRDVEQDKCTIGVAPYNSAQYPDLEDFLANNFDSAEKLEKHTYVLCITQPKLAFNNKLDWLCSLG